MATAGEQIDLSADDIDLTSVEPPPAPGSDRAPVAIPFDPSKQRENVRGIIAGALLALLSFIIVASFISYWWDLLDAATLEGLLTIIFAPVLGLVGAATGFYFGGSTDNRTGG